MTIELHTLWPWRTDALQRRERCLLLGSAMRFQFEDETSVRHQILEVLQAECITDAAQAQQVVDSWAHLLGDGRQWNATLFIEIPEAPRRERELPLLSLAAHHPHLGCAHPGCVWQRAIPASVAERLCAGPLVQT